ncbi:MAG: amidohydrolase family protein, partial [Phycisphaerales bacterium]|nr:amidohydrolase family protein [Phycisphaerales bacterium]
VARGLSPVMHAIGDAAVKAAIDAVGDLSDDCRATIEHAEVMTPEIIEALSNRSSLRLSIQPLHRADDAVFAEMALGPERSGSLLPMAAVNRLGVRMAFGSDWPVVSVDPIAGMQAAITGRDVDGKPFHQEQAIGVEEALRSYTVRAAEMSGLDHVGVLEAGRRADFVVWDRDPFTVDWDVQRPSIMATIVDGKLAYGSLPSQEQSS